MGVQNHETTLHLIPQPPPKPHKIPLPMQSSTPRPPSAPKGSSRPKSSTPTSSKPVNSVYDRSKGRRIVEKKQRPVSAFSTGLATGKLYLKK